MACVCGVDVPEELYYDVEEGVWLRAESDGSVTLGISAHGLRQLGTVASYSPRRIGHELRQGMSGATLQSLDWVEPARSPVAGVVVAVNERAQADPALISRDPYGGGWLLRLETQARLEACPGLVTGQAAVLAHRRRCAEEASA